MKEADKKLASVAVLMATYNGERFIEQQLDSILAQEDVDVHVFVRDDHSSDQTRQLVLAYQEQTKRVLLLNDVPYQLYAAKNFMSLVKDVDISAFDYMAYCDQDDVWLPGKLSESIAKIKKEKRDCYASNLLMGDADANVIPNRSLVKKIAAYLLNYKRNKKMRYDFYFESASAGCTLVLNQRAAVYLKKIFTEEFERIPVRASHDWSTYAVTRLGGFEWYIDSRSFIIYRQHSENAYGANIGRKAIGKLLKLFTSGWYRQHILMIDELYNRTGTHPSFIEAVRSYQHTSILSRFRMAFAVSSHRRKWVHRVMLFFLIIFGYCK
ncbi:glycosyltransferase [Sediminibacterium roseum]|uniref:Glycosyltransferase n=1 Tax=Sediminibacterium roseum TaxID=1978412 RepID=A0ABW9ZRA1_9BACT|nr:glycosyltransferase [Sediminibacterium roseum]NCI49050.1 glycosyltransferase [Sediminibacterium roseum]